MKLAIQILLGFFSLLLFFSASVQYNDPDPIHWIFLYGYSAFLCAFGIFKNINKSFLYFSLGAVVLQLLIVLDGAYFWWQNGMENLLSTPMGDGKPYIEQMREFLGTSIVGVSNLLLLYWQGLNKK
jgi:hypothetical protein